MGLSTSLYTGLSGLGANSEMISVAGNNISNANTTAFKSSRINFDTQISNLLRPASAPGVNAGGVNPAQVGLGVKIGSITRNFNTEAPKITGNKTDMAVDGNGFFVLRFDDKTRYTRAGDFTLDSENKLVRNGGLVQGYAVDEDFNILEGQLTDLTIPLGKLSIAQATDTVSFAGNLNAGGELATQGTLLQSAAMYSDATATTFATAADNLDGLFDASGAALFASGDLITIKGVTKGGAVLPAKTFEIGGANTQNADGFGATLGDFTSFMEDIIGIDTSLGAGGVTVNASGQVEVSGNAGVDNDIEIDDASIIRNQATDPKLPLSFDVAQHAVGESVKTSFVAYDSLGTPLVVDMSLALESTDNTGSQWRFITESDDDSGLDRVLGNGLLRFDTEGQLINVMDSDFIINRDQSGAFTPQSIHLDFVDAPGAITALTDQSSEIAAVSQDGAPMGVLDDFTVNNDGSITGIFSNSLMRSLGQVTLAMFANPEGLEELGSSVFNVTSNSGRPIVVKPGNNGAGLVVGQALELSNVDLSEEFITLINATTGFSASSRVVTTSERMLQELLTVVR